MSKRNPEYDFAWCPGCGDFGVRRALQVALENYSTEHEEPQANNIVVAGIGCSGNMVHLVEGDQPFGLHGIHGRALPISFGVKMAKPELNTVVVAGDGDFLSIGAEHIGPAANRNLDVTAVVMDNGVYGLTKGQSSPTTDYGAVTVSTPLGKIETPISPLRHYMSIGVTYIASYYSSKPRVLAKLIQEAMNHRGFSIVHVQSPCTTYNDTYEILKGKPKEGIKGLAYDIPEDHDPTSVQAANDLLDRPGIPLGVIFKYEGKTLQDRYQELQSKAPSKTNEQLLDSYLLKV
ncbi:MAG: thiamine pyrophosphate-dependent enzyme [Chloroflexota bacterium]|nr:thiamine pyrophosphate-dependent enzyme [Chloroflexota bacterium]MQG37518.1 2-oxoacid:ferredoxin oxidoreductase subunit beta [SAR202 cluster bacterium]|tara:strand:- start:489 stop:1358 length:870 start_codon:yes stop_codon:yes gene_type:complete